MNKTEFIKFLQSYMIRTRELQIAALDTNDDWGMPYFEGQMDTIKHIKTMVENNIFDFATDEVVWYRKTVFITFFVKNNGKNCLKSNKIGKNETFQYWQRIKYRL